MNNLKILHIMFGALSKLHLQADSIIIMSILLYAYTYERRFALHFTIYTATTQETRDITLYD